ncbi:glycoside hydrolase family 43 protein [Lasiosphaeria miniovina]|uniref:Glycoside hydrolase family 43 protein n=1 Tax=Lasiosphaeria miniovina TaxID=1954250 RepID=A0AA40A5I4_9PEZI|nr:glycoside hydrolase family 43 protein [Lasiosphaeria miniovina]KAK0709664.1 glycoside hydrolase family 43 protein [Lasiosphaeria miniovina]
MTDQGRLSHLFKLLSCFLAGISRSLGHAGIETETGTTAAAANSTYYNPILPGFHPDPSCIFVPERDNTFFCASSSFNAFPGIPIHASKDLQSWKLIGHVLDRLEQLPRLSETNRSTSGIWAPALRFHKDTFWVVTTLVDDDRPQSNFSRWDNLIFKAKDPFKPASWSDPVHFNFTGYDTEPFWDVDGKVYITGAHAWQVGPAIQQAEADLDTGKVGEWRTIWNGTGGLAPEGPHIYRRDSFYYLLAAEGGTGLNHMVTMARSKSISGPFEANPANPVLTNANTTSYFQTVGHADLFQDHVGNWWAAALSTRSGPEYVNYPMGRETVLTPVQWTSAKDWPVFSSISGEMSGWALPARVSPGDDVGGDGIGGTGPYINQGDLITFFPPGSSLPPHFTYWRFPRGGAYTISPPERPGTLRLLPSALNLTALNGNYAGGPGGGQTFVGRRQQDTLFSFSVDVSFAPPPSDREVGVEAGVTAFLTQNHHLDLGVVLLPANTTAGTTAFPGPAGGQGKDEPGAAGELVPHVRFRGMSSSTAVPGPVVARLPRAWWRNGSGGGGGGNATLELTLEIKAANTTHFMFSVGLAGARSAMQTIASAPNDAVSWGFTGTILGVYCTSNGGNGTTPAYISKWRYIPEGQFYDRGRFQEPHKSS